MFVKRVSLTPNLFNWSFYSSIEGLRKYRKLALEQFISDYSISRERKRYIKAELPKLPFDDRSLDLVLSGHLLFTYSHKFDFSSILSSITELCEYVLEKLEYTPCKRQV